MSNIETSDYLKTVSTRHLMNFYGASLGLFIGGLFALLTFGIYYIGFHPNVLFAVFCILLSVAGWDASGKAFKVLDHRRKIEYTDTGGKS